MDKSKDSKTQGSETQRGIRGLDSTAFFRITNFELFVKPNKIVMAFGLLSITCCIGYIAYMRMSLESDKTYISIDEDGKQYVRPKRSRWD